MIEVIPEKITVADRIRGMNDQELNEFLFRFKFNACGCFIKKGGAGLFDVKQQLDLLQTDENLADLRDCEFSNCFQWRHNDDQ